MEQLAEAVRSKRILDLIDAKRLLNVWRLKDDVVVFTNGCFDILHRGHVQYLEEAAALGDRLVIGLNSDTSVMKQGKGPGRPINDQDSRALVLAALRCVDAVVIFEDETPYELIKELTPAVLVKGGDWKKEDIVGGDIVEANGGEVKSLQLVDGFSTTSIVQRILRLG